MNPIRRIAFLTLALSLTPCTLALTQVGDTEPDGDVDGADFVTWSNHVGLPSSAPFYTFADFDHDGDVDGSDFIIWANHVNQPPPEPSGIAIGGLAALPEPSLIVPLAACLPVLRRPRRTRN
jgi:hypothetical protein